MRSFYLWCWLCLVAFLLAACGGGDSGSSQIGQGSTGAAKRIPTISAIEGPSSSISSGQTVQVQAAVEYSGSANELVYAWTQTGGVVSVLPLSGADTAVVSFVAPNVQQAESIELTLTVTGADGTAQKSWTGVINP